MFREGTPLAPGVAPGAAAAGQPQSQDPVHASESKHSGERACGEQLPPDVGQCFSSSKHIKTITKLIFPTALYIQMPQIRSPFIGAERQG